MNFLLVSTAILGLSFTANAYAGVGTVVVCQANDNTQMAPIQIVFGETIEHETTSNAPYNAVSYIAKVSLFGSALDVDTVISTTPIFTRVFQGTSYSAQFSHGSVLFLENIENSFLPDKYPVKFSGIYKEWNGKLTLLNCQ